MIYSINIHPISKAHSQTQVFWCMCEVMFWKLLGFQAGLQNCWNCGLRLGCPTYAGVIQSYLNTICQKKIRWSFHYWWFMVILPSLKYSCAFLIVCRIRTPTVVETSESPQQELDQRLHQSARTGLFCTWTWWWPLTSGSIRVHDK